MGKRAKSQWDFGELFPPEQTRRVLSVSELTGRIRRLLEQQVGTIWVTGEVTNLRIQSSGHIYFSLKDAGAQLNCVLFRGETVPHRDLLEDGQKLLLQGDVTVYEARGQYQLIVRSVELQGIGALQVAFEKLKRKLEAEGLFASERKRSLPEFPQRIGLVTSASGAAIRDVLHVVRRRHPGLEIVLVPCRVQGLGAAEEIATAITDLNALHASRFTPHVSLDLILVTRGGGSLEDLWAFNEEVVARSVAASAVPVVSAVGHEIDFTICDFVADVRAATPSAAAEIITEGVFSSSPFVAQSAARLRQLCLRQVEDKMESLDVVTRRLALAHPRRRLNEWVQRLDDLQNGLSRCIRQSTREQRLAWTHLAERLMRLRPAQVLKQRRDGVEQEISRLREQGRSQLHEWQNRLQNLAARLRLLGPEQVLARGYSITMDAATGKVLRAAEEAQAGQQLKSRLAKGEVLSKVEPDD